MLLLTMRSCCYIKTSNKTNLFSNINKPLIETASQSSTLEKLIYQKKLTEANVLKQILYALSYCHEKNLVHRDIKPQNILTASKRRIMVCEAHRLYLPIFTQGFVRNSHIYGF